MEHEPAEGLRRIARGLLSWAMVPVFPLGRLVPSSADRYDVPEREPHGLTLILTGILGRGFLEQQIALGIADAGVPGRISIVDWTTGNPLRPVTNLRARGRAADRGREIADRVAGYLHNWPGRPVNIVGYSGGGYLALLLLEALPPGVRVTQTILLAPSCSGHLDVAPLAERTESGLIHFRSPLDVVALGLLTFLLGTMDGRHTASAGLTGFYRPQSTHSATTLPAGLDDHPSQIDLFREIPYRFPWLKSFHYGGHFGYANRVWAGEIPGRLLRENLQKAFPPSRPH